MRLAVACCGVLVTLAAAACSTQRGTLPLRNEPGALPFDAGGGVGSERGNYGGRFDGQTRDAAGERCFVFNWDRPLGRDFAIRYTSISCESKAHPVWMTTTTFTRRIVPIAQSHLADSGGAR